MTRCAHVDCVDEAVVAVEFAGGLTRHYCQFHAQHVGQLETAEVA